MELLVEIADWFSLDEASLRNQVFAAATWTLPEDACFRLRMPVYEAVRLAIASGLPRVPAETATEQQHELDLAAERMRRLKELAREFLYQLMRYYGGRAAATGCAQLLRLAAAEITGRLASFQTWEVAVRSDLSWYDIRDGSFSASQAISAGSRLIRVRIDRESRRERLDIWLPASCLRSRLEYSTEIDTLTWVSLVLPQCGLNSVLGASFEIPWLPSEDISCSPESDEFSGITTIGQKSRIAKLCLNAVTDPPTVRVGPYIFPAPGTSGEFIESGTLRSLRNVVQVGPKEWKAPSIWHAVLWLRDLAAWNQLGRPDQAPLTRAFKDSPPGAFLFRGQRNATWSLTPSIFRLSPVETAHNSLAVLRFLLANMHLQYQAEVPLSLGDAFIGAAQHYGLPTWYLDFSVDPLSAAFFASDNAREGDDAAIYWLSLEEAVRHGAKLVLAPFWVERVYAQLGCFLDRSVLMNLPGIRDELADQCYRIVFPASHELAESEYGNLDHRIYPESEWVKAAIEWSRNSETPPENGAQLASELVMAAGQPPWISESTRPVNLSPTFAFMSRIVEWTALRLNNPHTPARSLSVDNQSVQLLFKHNPGFYQQYLQVFKVIKGAGYISRDGHGDIQSDIGTKAIQYWLDELLKSTQD
jgi:hypothetical protein